MIRVFYTYKIQTVLSDEQDRLKRAVTMLLNGATLQSHPCPYCKGVRVIKNGNAFCVNCKQEPEERQIPQEYNNTINDTIKNSNSTQIQQQNKDAKSNIIDTLEDELVTLAEELKTETNKQKKIETLDAINKILETLDKAKYN